MKKLMTTILVLLVTSMFTMATAQETEKTNFCYVAYDQSGTYGISYGLGFTLGKVSIVPNTRYALGSDLATGGLNYEKSASVEIIYWPAFLTGANWKIGIVAAPIQVDWLEVQDNDLGAYLTQAGGVAGTYSFGRVAVLGALKGTSQLLATDTAFKDRLRFIAGLSVKI